MATIEALSNREPFSPAQYCLLCLGSTVGFAVLRLVLHIVVFKPFARLVLLDAKQRQLSLVPAKYAGVVDKFCESLWKLLFYCSMWAFAYWALHDKEWLWDTRHYWLGMPGQLQSPRVELLYGIQTGFYGCSVFMLRYWETRRKDYYVMMTHHFTTLMLLVTSHHFSWQRIGSIILLLHDTSDILLELAKLLNYAGQEAASIAAFLAMAGSWFYLRLYLFPRHIIYSSMYEYQQVHGRPIDYYYPMNGMLIMLLVMHMYWFSQICKVAVRSLHGSIKDVREEDD